MNAHKVVPREIQSHGNVQIVEFFAETQTESRHASEKRSHAKVATLHMRCANHLWVGIAGNDFWDRPMHSQGEYRSRSASLLA